MQDVKDKKEQASYYKYGVRNVSQSPIVRQKILEATGKEYTLSNGDVVLLDSDLEYAACEYLISKGHTIETQPLLEGDAQIWYTGKDNKQHTWFPDIKMLKTNALIEVKAINTVYLYVDDARRTRDGLYTIMNSPNSATRGKFKKTLTATGRFGKTVGRKYFDLYKSAITGTTRVSTEAVKGLGNVLSGVGKGGVGLGKSYLDMYGKAGAGAFNAVGKILGRNKTAPPAYVNIYLKDDFSPGDPLLSAKAQRDGVVFVDGDTVERSEDIIKPVFDPKTDECLITKDDIKHGLVDVDNKPLGSNVVMSIAGSSKIGGLLKGGGKLLKGLGKFGGQGFLRYLDIYKQVLGIGKEGVKGISSLFSGRTSKNTKEWQNNILGRLDDIVKIIKPKLATGDIDKDGDRDNSYKDIMQNKRSKQAARKNRAAMTGKVGIGSAVGGGLGGGLGGGSDDDEDEESGGGFSLTSILGGGAIASGTGWIGRKLGILPKEGITKAVTNKVKKTATKKITAAMAKKGAKAAATAAAEKAAKSTMKQQLAKGATKAAAKAAGKKAASKAAQGAAKKFLLKAGFKGLAKAGPIMALAGVAVGAVKAFTMSDEELGNYADEIGNEGLVANILGTAINPYKQGKVIAATARSIWGFGKDLIGVGKSTSQLKDIERRYIDQTLERFKKLNVSEEEAQAFIDAKDQPARVVISRAIYKKYKNATTTTGKKSTGTEGVNPEPGVISSGRMHSRSNSTSSKHIAQRKAYSNIQNMIKRKGYNLGREIKNAKRTTGTDEKGYYVEYLWTPSGNLAGTESKVIPEQTPMANMPNRKAMVAKPSVEPSKSTGTEGVNPEPGVISSGRMHSRSNSTNSKHIAQRKAYSNIQNMIKRKGYNLGREIKNAKRTTGTDEKGYYVEYLWTPSGNLAGSPVTTPMSKTTGSDNVKASSPLPIVNKPTINATTTIGKKSTTINNTSTDQSTDSMIKFRYCARTTGSRSLQAARFNCKMMLIAKAKELGLNQQEVLQNAQYHSGTDPKTGKKYYEVTYMIPTSASTSAKIASSLMAQEVISSATSHTGNPIAPIPIPASNSRNLFEKTNASLIKKAELAEVPKDTSESRAILETPEVIKQTGDRQVDAISALGTKLDALISSMQAVVGNTEGISDSNTTAEELTAIINNQKQTKQTITAILDSNVVGYSPA